MIHVSCTRDVENNPTDRAEAEKESLRVLRDDLSKVIRLTTKLYQNQSNNDEVMTQLADIISPLMEPMNSRLKTAIEQLTVLSYYVIK